MNQTIKSECGRYELRPASAMTVGEPIMNAYVPGLRERIGELADHESRFGSKDLRWEDDDVDYYTCALVDLRGDAHVAWARAHTGVAGEINVAEPVTAPTVEIGGVDVQAMEAQRVEDEALDRVTGDNIEGGHDPGDESPSREFDPPDDALVDESDDRDLASPSYSAGARGPDLTFTDAGGDSIVYAAPTLSEDELRLIAAGSMISAIKSVRERCGIGLKEAVDMCRAARATFDQPDQPIVYADDASAPRDTGRVSYRTGGTRVLHPDIARVRQSHPAVYVPGPLDGIEHVGGWREHNPETDEEWIPDDPDELAAIVLSVIASDAEGKAILDAVNDLGAFGDEAKAIHGAVYDLMYADLSIHDREILAAEAHAALECALVVDRKARACSMMADAHTRLINPDPYDCPIDIVQVKRSIGIEKADINADLTYHPDGEEPYSRVWYCQVWSEQEARIRNGEIGDES